ncbi:MAG: carbonic anhydrase [Planctomycetaceae bacterium]|nr:carbonic anhydrase [Planctomycetaceae bacterium]
MKKFTSIIHVAFFLGIAVIWFGAGNGTHQAIAQEKNTASPSAGPSLDLLNTESEWECWWKLPSMPAAAKDALQRLREGNNRFISEKSIHPNSGLARLKQTATEGQHPFVAILGCSDSRVPHELLFDQGFGDIFSVRVTGNICADDEMGSIEYAVEHLQMPLLVVLGHSKCGAVTAVVKQDPADGHLKKLVGHIVPAVESAKKAHPTASEDQLIDEAIKRNVYLAVQTLLDKSEIVRRAVEEKKLTIVPAIYDVSTGKVDFIAYKDEIRSSDADVSNEK